MRILLTNDDGVTSPGLWEAAEALYKIGEVIVCAPDRERSGSGSSVSLHTPIRADEYPSPITGLQSFTVQGTPADCVILALESLVQGSIDLVVSGINAGANTGDDIFISGTVGGALQGYFRGIPSIAISVTSLSNPYYYPAALTLEHLAQTRLTELQTQASGILSSPAVDQLHPRPPLLNINLPNLHLRNLRGARVTKLGGRSYHDSVQHGSTPLWKWYWISKTQPLDIRVEGTDITAIKDGYVSITPLQSDLTFSGNKNYMTALGTSLESYLANR